MAQSLRRPLVQAIGLSSSLQRRQFTQIPPRWGINRAQAQAKGVAMQGKMKASKSLKVMQKELMASDRGQVMSDMGLLEQTFVPSKTKYTALFKQPRAFLRFQYYRYRSRLRDLLSLAIIKWSSPRAGKRWYHRRIKLHRRAVRPKAVALHTEMYASFAAGDIKELSGLCTEGLLESFSARIRGRRSGEKVSWELLGYNGRPRVVSDRASMLPYDGMALRQAVVRIASRQCLTRRVGGTVVEGSGEVKDVVEYVVLQSLIKRWTMGPWKVWGTTQETSMKDVESWQKLVSGEGV